MAHRRSTVGLDLKPLPRRSAPYFPAPGARRRRRIPWLVLSLGVATAIVTLAVTPRLDRQAADAASSPAPAATAKTTAAAPAAGEAPPAAARAGSGTADKAADAAPAQAEDAPAGAGPGAIPDDTVVRPLALPAPAPPAPIAALEGSALEAPPATVPPTSVPPSATARATATAEATAADLAATSDGKATPNAAAVPPSSAPEPLTLVVNRGDSLDRLFRRHDLSVADLHAMLQLDAAAEGLRLVRPGDEIHIERAGRSVLSLSRRLDDYHVLAVARDADGYHAEVATDAPERRVVHAAGRIDSSLFNAGREAGVSDALVMALAGIFAWDIDFVLDIRQGDEFVVLYEELWRDGVKLRDGAILAAEFVNTGQRYQAIRYVDPEGNADYFTPDGRSMRKAFLRAPVDFTRISSNFNPNRRHPVLNTIRAHRGVDYAAPPGTPIKAAGDGKIVFRGVKGGYGNTVILQHGDNVTTLYAHMSKFGRPRHGERVRQGEVIGYVGMSGLATGNHLHYEYRLNGVHRNPRTVPLPKADPVPARYRRDFDAHAEHVMAQLRFVKGLRLADAGAAGGAGPTPAAAGTVALATGPAAAGRDGSSAGRY